MNNFYDDVYIHYVVPQQCDIMAPRLAAVDRKHSLNPWKQSDFRDRLKKSSCHAMVAEVDGRIAGHMIYESHSSHFQLLKLEVNPTFNAYHIKEKLFEQMIGKLRPNEKTQIVFDINENDTGTQCMLRDRYGFKADKKIQPHYFENGDNAYVMRYQAMPLAERLRHMLGKLIDMTGMEWQAVERIQGRSFTPTAIKDDMQKRTDIDSLAFRTSGNVKDPKGAFKAICEYFGTTPANSFLDSLDHARRVTVPACWVQQIHITKGTHNELAHVFVPSDFQSRIQRDDGEARHHRG